MPELSPEEYADYRRMRAEWKRYGIKKGVIPPMVALEGSDGQKLGVDTGSLGIGEIPFIAELEAESGGAWTWVERKMTAAGTWADGDRSGTLDAYPAEPGTGTAPTMAVNDLVWMRSSPTTSGTWEFVPFDGGGGLETVNEDGTDSENPTTKLIFDEDTGATVDTTALAAGENKVVLLDAAYAQTGVVNKTFQTFRGVKQSKNSFGDSAVGNGVGFQGLEGLGASATDLAKAEVRVTRTDVVDADELTNSAYVRCKTIIPSHTTVCSGSVVTTSLSALSGSAASLLLTSDVAGVSSPDHDYAATTLDLGKLKLSETRDGSGDTIEAAIFLARGYANTYTLPGLYGTYCSPEAVATQNAALAFIGYRSGGDPTNAADYQGALVMWCGQVTEARAASQYVGYGAAGVGRASYDAYYPSGSVAIGNSLMLTTAGTSTDNGAVPPGRFGVGRLNGVWWGRDEDFFYTWPGSLGTLNYTFQARFQFRGGLYCGGQFLVSPNTVGPPPAVPPIVGNDLIGTPFIPPVVPNIKAPSDIISPPPFAIDLKTSEPVKFGAMLADSPDRATAKQRLYADFTDLSIAGTTISATVDGQTRTAALPSTPPGIYTTISVVGTVSYTTAADCNKVILVSNSGIPNTINIPAAATAGAGAWFIVTDIAGNAASANITIDGNASETINGATTYVISANYGSVHIVCNGTSWTVV